MLQFRLKTLIWLLPENRREDPGPEHDGHKIHAPPDGNDEELSHSPHERRRSRYETLGSVFGFAASPDQVLKQTEERTRLRQALGALKTDQVALILLRAEGLSYAELAAVLCLNPSSVGTLLARVEEAFRKEYVDRYGKPSNTRNLART